MGVIMRNGVAYGGGGGVSQLSQLSDVDISTPSNNQVLGYDSTSGKWENMNAPSGASSMFQLTDVDLTSLANHDTLVYDSTNQEWVNESNHIKTIELTQAQYDALSSTEKNRDDVQYYISDSTQTGVDLNDSLISSNKVWSSEKTRNEIGYWSNQVACIVGDTSCIITDSHITTTGNIVIRPYQSNASNTSVKITSKTISSGSCVLTFPALTEATTFVLQIISL